jgi:hypothetical protein
MNRQVMERLKAIASGQLEKPEVISADGAAESVTAEAAPVEPSSAPVAVEAAAETVTEAAAETESKPKKARKKKLSTE